MDLRGSTIDFVRQIMRRGRPASATPLCRGALDYVYESNGRLTLEGWMQVPRKRVEAFRLDVDEEPVVVVKALRRPDAEAVNDWRPSDEFRGFLATIPLPPTRFDTWCVVDVLGVSASRPEGRLRFRYRSRFRDGIPTPPKNLTFRTTNLESEPAYWAGALQMGGELFAALAAATDVTAIRRLLDWGCGCGRLTSLFLANTGIPEIHGCDIDAEAVGWCSEHLPRGTFRTIRPHPPTPYDDEMFDAVISYSVFTHLTQDVQVEWLKEMRRVLRKGGLFLASVHGEFAAAFHPDVRIPEDLHSAGISDRLLDVKLDGIAPAGYYRSVYQTREYTYSEWSKHFEIVDYFERVLGPYQDLVVMRKAAK